MRRPSFQDILTVPLDAQATVFPLQALGPTFLFLPNRPAARRAAPLR